MGLMKKLTSAIVASSLVFATVGTAFAAYTPASGETAGNRMMGLQILKGKSTTDPLALKDEITRAELVTIIVRAFGKEADAALLNGAAAFPDTASHWASGNIAMAKALVEKAGGDAIGMPDGSFNPDGKLTPAQAVAFLMKFLGVKADSTKAWPANYLDKAVELNLITAEDNALIAPMLNDNATRGLVFYMFDRAFYNYDLGAGKTFYTKYVDPTAPVITLGTVEPTTLDSKVTITGKVEGATEVYVGSKSVTVDANGNFSADYDLPEVKEYNIAVTARDLAGNTAEKPVVVARTTGNAAAIEAAAITVAAGQTVDVAAVVKDAKGNALTGVAVSGESTVGTFEGGKFTAGKTAGTGTLTLKAGEATANVNVTVTAGALAVIAPSASNVKVGEQVTLTAQDEFGNAIAGVSYTNDSTDALLDGTKGVFVASAEGTYTITGSKDGKTATATIGVYSSTVKKLVVTAPASVVGNSVDNAEGNLLGAQDDKDTVGSAYEVTVKAVDGNGNLVANYGEYVYLELANTGFIAAEDEDAALVVADPEAQQLQVLGVAKKAVNGVVTFKVLGLFDAIGHQYDLGATTVLKDGTVIGDASSELTTATVALDEQVATSVKISTSSTRKYIRSNDGDDKTSVSIYVADQNGKKYLETNGYTVNVAVTGAATIGTTADPTVFDRETSMDLTYTGASKVVYFESIKGTTGAATLTASVEGLGSATASVTAAIAGDAKKITLAADDTTAVAAGVDTRTYTIQITDANGVPVKAAQTLKGTFNYEVRPATDADGNDQVQELWVADYYTGTRIDVAPGTDKSTFSITTDAQGKAKIDVAAWDFVGDLKLTVSDPASKLSASDSTVTFKADVAKQFALTRTSTINVAYGAPTTSLSVQVYDKAGNKAAESGKKIQFASTSDVKFNGTAKKLEVVTDANGKATVDVSVLGYVNENYLITVTGTDLNAIAGKDTVTVSVVNAIASKMTYTMLQGSTVVTRVKAGEAVTVKVAAKDAAGRTVGDAEKIVLIPSGEAYTDLSADAIDKTVGTALTYSDNGTADTSDDYYFVDFYPVTAGSFSFTLKDKTPSVALEQAGTIRVIPGDASQLVINGGDNLEMDYTKATGAISLKLTDDFGNGVATGTSKEVTYSFEKWDDTNADGVIDAGEWVAADGSFGLRTSTAAPDVAKLTIPAGNSSTSFYIWNSLEKGTYLVTFTDGTNSGTLQVTIK